MKVLAILVAVVATTVSAPAVSAGPPTSADLAADCNDDGRVDVVGRSRYVGGSGTISGSCTIVVTPGSTFEIRRGEITGPGPFIVIAGPFGRGSTVRVIDTTIDVTSFLEMTPGANAGDPGVPDDDASVLVRRSKLRGAGIILATSLDWSGGRTIVRDSDLVATTGNISIEASRLGGVDGLVRVVDSALTAPGTVTIASGDSGRTVVRRSTLGAGGGGVVVMTGLGGTCRTRANTPAVTCI